MSATIPLTRGYCTIVDDADFGLVSGYTWFTAGGFGHYHLYAYTTVKRRTVLMHRLIMGAGRGDNIDHANGDGLDNRRANLRFCTITQNCANTRREVGKSGYRGVQIDGPPERPYRAKLTCSGQVHRGRHCADAISAAIEYDDLARKHFGEFAILNFPSGAPTIQQPSNERAA